MIASEYMIHTICDDAKERAVHEPSLRCGTKGTNEKNRFTRFVKTLSELARWLRAEIDWLAKSIVVRDGNRCRCWMRRERDDDGIGR